MDHATAEEIIRRVLEQLQAAPSGEEKPRLLLLARQHGTACHALLESAALRARYRVDCAQTQGSPAAPEDYEAVILFGFSCDAMSELAAGCCTSDYTRLARRALLLGRKLYIPSNEVELYRYQSTAPAACYEMLRGQMALLESFGVVVCSAAELVPRLLGTAQTVTEQPPCNHRSDHGNEEGTFRCEKRVLTERDVSEAAQRKARRILAGSRCIVTALAQDLAEAQRIEIVRCEREGGGR